MIQISEKKLHDIVHDILKVIGELKILDKDCLDESIRKQLIKYEKKLMGIREDLITSTEEVGD